VSCRCFGVRSPPGRGARGAGNGVDVREKSSHLTPVAFYFFDFLIFLRRERPHTSSSSSSFLLLLLHVLIDCSLRVSGDPAQLFANPPEIITPRPGLRGTRVPLPRAEEYIAETSSLYGEESGREASHLPSFSESLSVRYWDAALYVKWTYSDSQRKGSQTLLRR